MNTTGFMRGYMAKNMKFEDFINHVVEQIGKEFESEITLTTTDRSFEINMEEYYVSIDKEKAEKLHHKGAYILDKCILNKMKEQGLIFSEERSQYIRYCYGMFNYKVDGSVY